MKKASQNGLWCTTFVDPSSSELRLRYRRLAKRQRTTSTSCERVLWTKATRRCLTLVIPQRSIACTITWNIRCSRRCSSVWAALTGGSRMKEKLLYTTDTEAIRQRVEQAGLLGVYNEHV